MNNTTSRLSAKIIAAHVEDHLDDFLQADLISNVQFQKATSQLKILSAINEADMECCRLLKQKVQMIVFAEQGTSEIFLDNGKSPISPINEASLNQIYENQEFNSKILLNREWFVDASEIHGEYLHLYDYMPVGDAKPGQRVKIVHEQGFNIYDREGYNDAYGNMEIVYYEASQKRLRFGSKFDKDTFLSFTATLVPSKIDLDRYNCKYEDYIIKSPSYTERFIVASTLLAVMPFSTAAREAVSNELNRERVKLFSLIPQNTSSMEITNGYIG